jgi:sterol desaturase/sphingolipid hydroxylase (fatty acid hydroxylase superfamily)
MRAARRLVSLCAFPLVLGGTCLGAALAMRSGTRPETALAVATVLPAFLILGLERVFPAHRAWLRSHGDVRVDLAHLVSVSLTAGLVRTGVFVAFAPAAVWLAARTDGGVWPHAWPWAPQVVLALVVAELPKYWLHRLMHERDFLWRFHATHHSVPRLYWLNAVRFHPIDIGLDTAVGLVPLALLGCGPEVLALFLLVSAVHGYFQHANLPVRLGPLNYFFSMAELHRWHHSPTVWEANHNYGQNVIVWDLVFRTFFWPHDREPPEDTGLADLPAFPTTYWAQLASPLRWARIKAGGA